MRETEQTVPLPDLGELQRLDQLDGEHIDIRARVHGYPSYYPAPLTRSQLGLVLAEERGSHVVWMGIGGENVHPHDRWLYHSVKSNRGWAGIGRPHPSIWDSVMLEDEDMTRGMRDLHSGVTQTIRALMRSTLRSSPVRDGRFVLTHYQVFGHMDPNLIALLPEDVDWVALHEILHHTDAWCAANDAVGMPRELVLRMHGLSALVDLPADLPLDPTVARLLGRRVKKMNMTTN